MDASSGTYYLLNRVYMGGISDYEFFDKIVKDFEIDLDSLDEYGEISMTMNLNWWIGAVFEIAVTNACNELGVDIEALERECYTNYLDSHLWVNEEYVHSYEELKNEISKQFGINND